MNQQEVIEYIQNYLKEWGKNGTVTKSVEKFCITFIYDSIPSLTRPEAEIFYKSKVLGEKQINKNSKAFHDVTFSANDNGYIIKTENNGVLAIEKENMKKVLKEMSDFIECIENAG